ncbi:hypothetical protein BASA81_006649 [Batrachochytrium salamandrivorans]|nr:hypothetical protein BASA81_006649 [Batrachochytrium salamandrivorans]
MATTLYHARHYPQSPPSCLQCPPNDSLGRFDPHSFIPHPLNESCFLVFGSGGCQPQLNHWPTSWPFLGLYSLWLITLGCALVCFLPKLVRRPPKQAMREESDEEGYGVASTVAGLAQDVGIEYYRYSRAELVAKILFLVNGLVLVGFYLALCMDFYYECENNWTLDNLCFFGTFRLMGSYASNSEAFFLVWFAMVTYALVGSLFGLEILQWTRIKVSEVNQAELVRVFLLDNTRPLVRGVSETKLSLGVRVKRRFVRWWNLTWFAWGKFWLGVHLQRPDGRFVMVDIHSTPITGFRYFVLETVRYDAKTGRKVKLTLDSQSTGAIRSAFMLGHSSNSDELTCLKQAREHRQDICGPNTIPLYLPSLAGQTFEEFTSPFYAYQVTIYLIWIYWTYWFVGLVLLAIVLLSGLGQIYIKRRSLLEVHNLAKHRDGVSILLPGEKEFTSHETAHGLTPGDVVKVDGGGRWTVPADLVLCQGSCAVDESGLTGESMPRSKTALPPSRGGGDNDDNDEEEIPSQCLLYAGTLVLEASADCQAVVIAIGCDATRGKLLSQVLFPTKLVFQFEEEFTVCLLLLLGYAVFSFFLAIWLLGVGSWPTLLSYGVMTVSQILNPMLKIALQAGRVSSTKRLRAKQITCMDQSRIDICGKVQVFCFDKTGTLTEPTGLRLLGVTLPWSNGNGMNQELQAVKAIPECAELCAVCHSLSNFNGQLLGPSVEVEMFTHNGQWRMVSENEFVHRVDSRRQELVVKQRFGFCQTRRTMSVLLDNNVLYVKGAPESLAERCRCQQQANDFLQQAEELSAQGCYVLAMATRRVVVETRSRDELECDLDFMGLLVFRNELKPDAAIAIAELKRGRVRPVMITGDNLACGMFVAKQSGMITQSELNVGIVSSIGNGYYDSFGSSVVWSQSNTSEADRAISGEAFDLLVANGELAAVLPQIRVFARMSPSQKVQVVEAFMDLGLICAMAGDGGNDSGALRAAHAGLSYSTCEASVVAPFTSKSDRVWACVDLLIEGRASMHTSLSTYKFLVVYGLMFSLVKFVSFYYGILMSLMGYILIDMVATVPLTYWMTTSASLPRLGVKRPTGALLGWQTIASVLGAVFIVALVLMINLNAMHRTEGYVQWPKNISNNAAWWIISDNWESTIVFQTCYLFYISTAVVFSLGSGFRSALYLNTPLLGVWFGLFAVSTYALLGPSNSTLSFMFHSATEQFNREKAENPVWIAYQAKSGEASIAMPFELCVQIWLTSALGALGLLAWEYFIVFGQVPQHQQEKGVFTSY